MSAPVVEDEGKSCKVGEVLTYTAGMDEKGKTERRVRQIPLYLADTRSGI